MKVWSVYFNLVYEWKMSLANKYNYLVIVILSYLYKGAFLHNNTYLRLLIWIIIEFERLLIQYKNTNTVIDSE